MMGTSNVDSNDKPQRHGNPVVRSSDQQVAPEVVISIGSERTESRLATSYKVDITFVFDTTGSMSSKIESLLSACGQLAEDMVKQRLNWRAAIVAFGDLTVPGDTIQATGYTDNLTVFRQMLKNVPCNGGGCNDGESSLEAIDKAITNSQRRGRSKAIKVFVLITDEPALHSHTASQITEQLLNHEILTFCVSPPEPYFKDMAQRTGGEWIQISGGTSLETIKQKLLKIARQVTEIVTQVCDSQLGDGSVKQYLALKSSK